MIMLFGRKKNKASTSANVEASTDMSSKAQTRNNAVRGSSSKTSSSKACGTRGCSGKSGSNMSGKKSNSSRCSK